MPRTFAFAAVNSSSLSRHCAFQMTEMLDLVAQRRMGRRGCGGIVLRCGPFGFVILLLLILLLFRLGSFLVVLRESVRL